MFSLSYHLQVVGLNTVSRNVKFNLLCFRAKKGWPNWRFKRRAGFLLVVIHRRGSSIPRHR